MTAPLFFCSVWLGYVVFMLGVITLFEILIRRPRRDRVIMRILRRLRA